MFKGLHASLFIRGSFVLFLFQPSFSVLLPLVPTSSGVRLVALSELSYGPLITLGALIATYGLAAAWAGSALRKRLAGPAPFAATSEELRKDRECIPHP
jgi:hypothetical protein